MAEYIDRNAFLEHMKKTNRYFDVKHDIKNFPAADAAPVVRCKHCKWFANNNGGEWFGCWLFNAIRVVPEDAPTPDDFCSHGERKTAR